MKGKEAPKGRREDAVQYLHSNTHSSIQLPSIAISLWKSFSSFVRVDYIYRLCRLSSLSLAFFFERATIFVQLPLIPDVIMPPPPPRPQHLNAALSLSSPCSPRPPSPFPPILPSALPRLGI